MRTTLLALFALGLAALCLAACGRPVDAAEDPAPLRLPSPGQSVVFGPAGEPTGGTIVVGHLIETRGSKTLKELLGEEAWQAFLESERADALDEGDVEEFEEIEEIEIWPIEGERGSRSAYFRAARELIRSRTKVRVLFRDVMPSELDGIPLVITDRLTLHANETRAIRTWTESGGILLFNIGPTGREVDPSLAEAIQQTIAKSPLIQRLPGDPLQMDRAKRDGTRIQVAFAGGGVHATLRDLDDTFVAEASIGADGTHAFECPDPALDPFRHRVVATWEAEGLTLRRAWTVEQLVGAAVRRVAARPIVIAGASYAPQVWFENSRTKAPVAGVSERIALVRGDATIAAAVGVSNEAGGLDLHLPVPADLAPGAAELVVGEDRFPVRVEESLRVSVVTDRSLYRATDEVHVRVMVHDGALGAPIGDREVVLRCGDVEKRVRTSKHGIASTRFRLVEAKLGPAKIQAEVGSARASAPLLIRAFERPTFRVTLDPEQVSLRPGEEAPLTVRAVYVNGAPVVGAAVRFEGTGGVRTPRATKTDATGRVDVAVKLLARAQPGRLRIHVQDADGRRATAVLPVELDHGERPLLRVEAMSDLVAGVPGRVSITGAPGARVRLVTPDHATTVQLDAAGRREVDVTPADGTAPLQAAYDGAELRWRAVETVLDPGERPVAVPARRTARVGETLRIHVRAPDGPVLVSFRRDGTPLRSRAVLTREGQATLDLRLDQDLAGLLVVAAWRPGHDRASEATVLVVRDRGLVVEGTVAAPSYRPAETALVDVRVRDLNGAPTSAVLGYWGVDEALLALRPWVDGYEDVFDVDGAEASPDRRRLARAVHRGRPPARPAHRRLGQIWMDRRALPSGALRHDGAVQRAHAVRTEVRARVDRDVERLRDAYLEAFEAMPLDQVRTASSLREVLARLARDGRLDRALLQDAWRTPFDVRRGVRHWEIWPEPVIVEQEHVSGVPVRSAGPDLELATEDDATELFRAPTAAELPPRLVRLLRFAAEHDEGRTLADAPFAGPSTNGLIGLGGGAGGAFRGRGGGRDLGRGGSKSMRGLEEAVHVREDLDPTLCFVPEAIVGEDGKLRLEIPLKDSITTWRLRLVASAADGATGIGETRIKVSQPLHVDPWVATHLTVGDELDLPVSVRNETDADVEAALTLETTEGLAVIGDAVRKASVGPRGTGAVTFRLRAVRRGQATLRVDADTGANRDAIRRIVHIRADAREVDETLHAKLERGRAWKPELAALADDVDRDVALRLYASPMATLIGGLEGLLTCPHG